MYSSTITLRMWAVPAASTPSGNPMTRSTRPLASFWYSLHTTFTYGAGAPAGPASRSAHDASISLMASACAWHTLSTPLTYTNRAAPVRAAPSVVQARLLPNCVEVGLVVGVDVAVIDVADVVAVDVADVVAVVVGVVSRHSRPRTDPSRKRSMSVLRAPAASPQPTPVPTRRRLPNVHSTTWMPGGPSLCSSTAALITRANSAHCVSDSRTSNT